MNAPGSPVAARVPATRPWLKVCGITREADARAAVEAGARAIGFVLVPESPRFVTPERAAAIARILPPEVARVGVVVDLPPDRVLALARTIGLTAIQAHGEETRARCAAYGLPVVKALSLLPGADLDRLEPYRDLPLLIDARDGPVRGGTGIRSDWALAGRAREAGFRILLAGGLTPETIEEAVTAVRPIAVDVNSGVESEPGKKDAARIRAVAARLDALALPEETPWPW